LSARAIDEINLRENDRVITECGCIIIPQLIMQRLGVKSAECDTHGDQAIVRKATGKEVMEKVLGLPLPEVPDIPEF
jgi:hypothetical protein